MLQSETVLPVEAAVIPNKKIRFSGVELLRIIAILLICINHAVQTSELFIDFDHVLSVGTVFLKLMRYTGQIGNILFVICSAYFLADSKRTKGEKALSLLIDSACIAIFILIGMAIGGYRFPAIEVLHQFFPDLWFIPVYVAFYAVHPLFNGAIERMDRRAHFTFVCVVTALGVVMIFVDISTSIINNFVGFAIVYFIVAYMKKYMQGYCDSVKKNVIVFCIFFGLFLVCAVLKYVFGMKSDYVRNTIKLDNYFSPLLLPALLSLFNLFNKMKFKNRAINYFASCSLFVYCFHENPLLRTIIRPQFYDYVLGLNADLYFLWVIVCAFGMFFGAYVLSVIYKETVHRLTFFISKKICQGLTAIINFLFKKSLGTQVEQGELPQNDLPQ